MQQELIDLLCNQDIDNIKIGIYLARNEGYNDSFILKHIPKFEFIGLGYTYNNQKSMHIMLLNIKDIHTNIILVGNDTHKIYYKKTVKSDSIQYSIVENEAAKIFLDLILNDKQ